MQDKIQIIRRIKLCECDCGQIVKSGNRFVHGHNWRGKTGSRKGKGKPKSLPRLCKCNCGGYTNSGRLYINGHYWIGRRHTKEEIYKMKNHGGRCQKKEKKI